jgi:mycothiol system anti-sigma-R factor
MSHPSPLPVRAIDCDTAVRRLWDFLDGELDPTRLSEVEQHLATCAACSEHVEFSRAFVRAIHDAAAPAASAQLDDALRQRVIARLTAEGFRRT